MGPLKWFLFVYILGGLTFIPLLIAAVLVFVYYTLPPPKDSHSHNVDDPAHISRSEDEKLILKSATDDLAEKFKRKHESDVAAGYFAVCREYVPGGVNGKPPDKLSPAGEVVANESPSVYQSMYRSIFDRSQKPTIEPNKDGAGKVKKANNVFYVVLRLGHLMLYDDIQQIDVRYVISLDYHDVDIYAGSDERIPEGELWAKRNAIRLNRKQTRAGDKSSSLPFYLFSDNPSEKEDFYHALLKNQQNSGEDAPAADDFDVQHIVTLVQKLHSSEEQLQTRWLNALIGRVFLAVYKTEELEDYIRAKLMKKMSKVKKPNFITRLALQKIHTGSGAPFITNPRLRDLTVNGDCTVEADVEYNGNFRIEVGATAEFDLGSRFKKREVDLVLAVTVRSLKGHGLLRIKPPPSNRVWITFEKMPQLDLAVEPIVSSRQITYSIILKAIESRIREVLAESMVLPFWDDIPFLSTKSYSHRGGIWKRKDTTVTPAEVQDEPIEDGAEAGTSGMRTPEAIALATKNDRTMSMPVLADTKRASVDMKKSLLSMNHALSSSVDRDGSAKPRVLRAPSFATVAGPQMTPNHVDHGLGMADRDITPKRDTATSVLKDLSARSANGSPAGSQAGSPPVDSALAAVMKGRSDSSASQTSSNEPREDWLAHDAVGGLTATPTATRGSRPTTPSDSTPNSRPNSYHDDGSKSTKNFAQAARSFTASDRKQALASATAAAQRWSTLGWGVISKNKQKAAQSGAQTPQSTADVVPSTPMGRGHPLPPPGVPLPGPQKSVMVGFGMPKRKPLLPTRPSANGSAGTPATKAPSSPKPPPPLPERRRRQSSRAELSSDNTEDEVLVVEAPTESAPTSPAADVNHDEFFGHTEELSESDTVMHAEPATHSMSDPPAATAAAEESSSSIWQDDRVNDLMSAQPPLSEPSTPPSVIKKPPLPDRKVGEEPTTPPSIRRKPTLPDRNVDVRPTSPQAAEATEQERNLSMQEAASIGGGFNE